MLNNNISSSLDKALEKKPASVLEPVIQQIMQCTDVNQAYDLFKGVVEAATNMSVMYKKKTMMGLNRMKYEENLSGIQKMASNYWLSWNGLKTISRKDRY